VRRDGAERREEAAGGERWVRVKRAEGWGGDDERVRSTCKEGMCA
jgi:hypothetical protein